MAQLVSRLGGANILWRRLIERVGLLMCADEKVVAYKLHTGDQAFVARQSFIDAFVVLVLQGRQLKQRQWRSKHNPSKSPATLE